MTSLATRPPGGRTALAIAAFGALYVWILCMCYGRLLANPNQYDDAYITYRYAVNLAERSELTFNSYERVNSASSLLYTLALAAVYKCGLHDLETVGLAFGVVSGFLGLCLTLLLAGCVTDRLWLAAAFILPVAVSGSLSGWAVSGMETIPYMALVTWFFLLYSANRTGPALCAMVACMAARPEGVLVFASVAAAEVVCGVSTGFRRLAQVLAVGGATCALLAAWNLFYYGTVLPHPLLFKQVARYYSPTAGENAVSIVKYFAGRFGTIGIPGLTMACLLAAGAAARLLKAQTPLARTASDPFRLALGFFALASIASFLFGPASDFHRYMVPLLPVLVVLSLLLAEHVLGLGSAGTSRVFATAFRWRVGAGVAVAVVGVAAAGVEQAKVSACFNRAAAHQAARKRLGEYIARNIPRDRLILSSDVGAIAYTAREHDFMDVLGLTSVPPVAAAREGRWDRFVDRLKAEKPGWVADTGTRDGKVSALEILARPGGCFRTGARTMTGSLDLYSGANRTMVEIPTADGYVFRIVRIDPAAYGTPSAERTM